MDLSWRVDADPSLVKLAIGRCLIAVMDRGKWLELGLLTSTQERLTAHPRLLRSLNWQDDDYSACVLEVTPWVLGEPARVAPDMPLSVRLPQLNLVTTFTSALEWLYSNDRRLFDQTSVALAGDEVAATLPDGTVLSQAESTAARLSAAEMKRQVERIRRDFSDDPESAIGQAKDLVETTCKTILGLTGNSKDTREDIPALVYQTLKHLGRHPTDFTDQAESAAVKKIFGSISNLLSSVGELRNSWGTGHGRAGTHVVDGSLARLAVSSILPAVVYICEAYEMSLEAAKADAARTVRQANLTVFKVGARVIHDTFGVGTIISAKELHLLSAEASVDFGDGVRRRFLLRYAPIRLA